MQHRQVVFGTIFLTHVHNLLCMEGAHAVWTRYACLWQRTCKPNMSTLLLRPLLLPNAPGDASAASVDKGMAVLCCADTLTGLAAPGDDNAESDEGARGTATRYCADTLVGLKPGDASADGSCGDP